MNANNNIDEARKNALAEIEKKEKKLKLGIVGIAFYEATLLLAFILVADWKNQLHQLIFISSLLVYGTLGLGLVALAAFVKINTARVLKAVGLLIEE